MKKNQHFVPQFYLRIFSGGERRIGLYGVESRLLVPLASIKHQCYRHHFYGKDERLENAFSQFEEEVAPILKKISESSTLPSKGTKEWILLMQFVSFQHLRTEAQKNLIDQETDLQIKAVLEEDSRIAKEDLQKIRVESQASVLLALSSAPKFAYGISDLAACLLVTPGANTLVTSDNPVVLYNQYCEDVTNSGVLGAICNGLQVFLPFTPEMSLMLYDARIYALNSSDEEVVVIDSNKDSSALNLLQAVHAGENIYFSPGLNTKHLAEVAQRAGKYRKMAQTKINKADGTNSEERSVLLHFYRPLIATKPDFGFIRVRRRARRVPVIERGHSWRKEMPEN